VPDSHADSHPCVRRLTAWTGQASRALAASRQVARPPGAGDGGISKCPRTRHCPLESLALTKGYWHSARPFGRLRKPLKAPRPRPRCSARCRRRPQHP
jgi:hypothetical protein